MKNPNDAANAMDTTDRICALRHEASEARDYEQVDLCTAALADDTDALIQCERIISEKSAEWEAEL